MPQYVSKIEMQEQLVDDVTEDGRIKKVKKMMPMKDISGHGFITKQYLCDKKGHILHDKSREDDPEGVNRRIEVEAFKDAIRKGHTLRITEKNKLNEDVLVYNEHFHEDFAGTMDQAEAEIKAEIDRKAAIEKQFEAEENKKK